MAENLSAGVIAPSTATSFIWFETLTADQLHGVYGGFGAQMFDAMEHAVGMGMQVNWITQGRHARTSQHPRGNAFDAIGTRDQMDRFFRWASTHGRPHEVIYRHRFLKDGHWRAGIGGHMGHVHYSSFR